ncbi:MAG: flavin oxidoreductase [Hyphomicrobiales bacterium]|nr:MAG: flavin oxidoreductase [Hyphomicrobiales bacterium]
MDVWSSYKFKCGLEAANRFVIAPLTTNSSNDDGTATDAELEFVRRRSANGFGATISSAAYIAADGRSWQGIGAVDERHLPSLKRIAEAMRAAGGLAILQIYDGGRIAKPELIPDRRLRAPSAIASLRPGAQTPRAMTSDEVHGLVESFRNAALLAKTAGFDGVEVHGANHYTVHQFFSPRANARTDEWGSSFAKRMAFPLAVARAVREGLGPKLIAGFRVTPFESEPGGYTLDDAKLLCAELAQLDLDYISISLDDFRMSKPMRETRVYDKPIEGGYLPKESPVSEISRVVAGRTAVMASGGIWTCADAEGAMRLGADLVAVGRAIIVDPEWLSKVKAGREEAILAGLPKQQADIADPLSIPRPMVDYLLSRPGWLPRLAE